MCNHFGNGVRSLDNVKIMVNGYVLIPIKYAWYICAQSFDHEFLSIYKNVHEKTVQVKKIYISIPIHGTVPIYFSFILIEIQLT